MLTVGIIGTNFISSWFAAACGRTDGRVRAAAVTSRDLGRAEAFARDNGIDRAFDNLDAMLDSVDALYVASPNGLHHTQAAQAIEAGRHVLIEKVMGTTLAEVQDTFAAAERRGVVAMEAVRNLHTPAHRLIREALPRLGTLRHARVEKLQYSSRYDKFRAGEIGNAFDPTLGNSALADIGVYCLQPALDWFGVPDRSSGASVRLSNGFEGGGTVQLDYGTLVADLSYSKVSTGLGHSAIHGEDGSLSFDDPAETSRVTFHPRGGSATVLLDLPAVDPASTMHHELLDFADQVERGTTDDRWRRISIESRRIMDARLAG